MQCLTSRYCKKNKTFYYISKIGEILQSNLIVDFIIPDFFSVNIFFYILIHKLFVFAFPFTLIFMIIIFIHLLKENLCFCFIILVHHFRMIEMLRHFASFLNDFLPSQGKFNSNFDFPSFATHLIFFVIDNTW